MRLPYYVLSDLSKEQIKKDFKSSKFFFTHTDLFITWIIGLSTAAIALIIGNIGELENRLLNNTKAIGFILSVSVFFALLYRIAVYFLFLKIKSVESFMISSFSGSDMSPILPGDIENQNFEQILKSLKDDFDVDLKLKESTMLEKEANHIAKVRQHYKDLCEISFKSYEIIRNSIAESYFIAYRTPIKKTVDMLDLAMGVKEDLNNKGVKRMIGFNLARWAWSVRILFFGSILSFLVAIAWIAVVFCFIL